MNKRKKRVRSYYKSFKKSNFVLLKKIGTPKVDIEVPSNVIRKGFDFYQS